MEKFQELRDEAKRKAKLADHMLTMTYPLVQDPKLLLSVLENIFLGLTNAMGAILHYERTFKSIPPFYDTFDSKFTMFRAKVVDKYRISHDYVNLMQDIKNIIVAHKESPVEFSRKDRFIICSNDYRNMQTITADMIKSYLNKAKEFINIMEPIVNKDTQIFIKH